MLGTREEAYRYIVGNIITNWAAYESRVASAIWQVGGIPDAIGASITSQIYTLDGKVKALQSILRVKGFDKEAKKLGKIIADTKVLADWRNRLVHDPVNHRDGEIYRLEIKADRYLSLGYQKVDMEHLSGLVDKIADADDALCALLKPVMDACPPLPLPETPS
jgi:hypothetical protein